MLYLLTRVSKGKALALASVYRGGPCKQPRVQEPPANLAGVSRGRVGLGQPAHALFTRVSRGKALALASIYRAPGGVELSANLAGVNRGKC